MEKENVNELLNGIYDDINAKNNEVLTKVLNEFGGEFRINVDEVLEINELVDFKPYEIVDSYKGDKEDEEEFCGSLDFIYIDQWRNGGYIGDDFAGDIYIPLPDGKFLKAMYQH